jgi:hypothetical protein
MCTVTNSFGRVFMSRESMPGETAPRITNRRQAAYPALTYAFSIGSNGPFETDEFGVEIIDSGAVAEMRVADAARGPHAKRPGRGPKADRLRTGSVPADQRPDQIRPESGGEACRMRTACGPSAVSGCPGKSQR